MQLVNADVWNESAEGEPPAGPQFYDCLAGSHTFVCQRLQTSDGIVWASQGFQVHGVTKWRESTALAGRPT